MCELDKIRQKRERIYAISAKHGACRLRAFGSVARNESRPESDFDILVNMEPGHDLLDIIALQNELETLLNRKTDVVSEDELSPYLKDEILRDAVEI